MSVESSALILKLQLIVSKFMLCVKTDKRGVMRCDRPIDQMINTKEKNSFLNLSMVNN